MAAALRESFGTEGRRMKLDFQGIVTQLAEVMYRSAAICTGQGGKPAGVTLS